ncbi:MAG: hypothetical protein IPG71_00040 [bacterium]|nr:hypothetical protein [bacterium]
MIRILTLLLFLETAFGAKLTQRSFLVSFPDIAYDEKQVVFANSEWAAIYSSQAGAMFTVPRDSMQGLTLAMTGRECREFVGNATFSCSPIRGNTLVKQDVFGNEDKVLPLPSARALTALSDAWHMMSLTAGDVQEEIGPLYAQGERIWFGLIAYHGSGQDPIAGLGWYDTRLDQFGRVYSDALADVAPKWLGARQDTVWMLCKPIDGKQTSKLIGYSIYDATIALLDPRAAGVPGDTILNTAIWRDAMLITTEQAVSVWPQGNKPWVWQTDAYASRDSAWLQFVTFDLENGIVTPDGDFFPLIPNQPAQAFAVIGNWIELLTPRGIEATMYRTRWDDRQDVLTKFDWGCGNNVCPARVKIVVKGEDKEMDLLDTPLVYIEGNSSRVRVGMQAGWIPLDQVVPVLMKK